MTKHNVAKGLNKFKSAFLILILLITVAALIFALAYKPKRESVKGESTQEIETVIKSGNIQDFTKLTNQLGPEKTYDLLKKHFPNNDAAAHDYAHVIGIVTHDQKGISNLKVCDTQYNYGCYHGFIEAFIAKNTVSEVSQIEEGCVELGTVHAPSCLHGIGHGVMVDASYKLDTALNNCSLLKVTSQIYCWDGVFMERIVGSMLTDDNKVQMTKDTLREPCNSVATTYKEQCWRNQVSAWYKFYSANTKEIGNQCSLVENQYQKTCFESLGLMVTITTGENQSQIINSCTTAGNQISDDCLIGSMKELLFEGKNPQVAQSLCTSISPKNQQHCQQTYAEHLAQSQARFGR